MLLLVVMIGSLTRVQVIARDTYVSNEYNKRATYEMKSVQRGAITAGGLVLAASEKGPDGFFHRTYPTDLTAYGPVVGFASDIYGLSGLEKSHNAVLSGKNLGTSVSGIRNYLSGKPTVGATVELTLNPQAQTTAYRMMAEKNFTGAVVALRPSTGEVLAMASTPSYNPALLADPSTARDTWQELTTPPLAENKPLVNHATQIVLPPGSTFKVITTAAALASGRYTPESRLTAASSITLPGSTATLENYGGEHCGPEADTSLLNAFQRSCNTAFAELGVAVGDKDLVSMADQFGVTDTYDLGLPYQPGTVGDLSQDSVRAQSAIGQHDVGMTVLENAVVAATIANGGVRMEPHVVSRVQAPDLSPVTVTKPKELSRPVSEQVAEQITQMMLASERFSGGRSGLASKTGTAEHGVDSRSSAPHAWYIAFDPGKDVAVAVVVENGGDRGREATGATVAAPIGRAVIAAAETVPAGGGQS
nr:penicillin-binding protein 2 [Corynebacterium mendelii]